jgi:hypothetical protein
MSSGQMRSNERNKSSSAVARDSAVGRGLKNSARASCKVQAAPAAAQSSQEKWRKQQQTAASESCTVANIAVVLLHTLLLVASTISV